jgi:hypothetical protein
MTQAELDAVPEGGIVYTFVASDESAAYGDTAPRKPYPAKVYRTRNGGVKVCRFDKVTGEPDHDTNASTYVYPGQVFATMEECELRYRGMKAAYARGLLQQAMELIDQDEPRKLVQQAAAIIDGYATPERMP